MGGSWNKGVDALLGGWQLGGIFTAHTGFPLTIKYNADTSGTGQRSFRVNVVGTPNDPHNIGPGALYLDPSAYAARAKGTYGNIGVGTARGPGMSRLLGAYRRDMSGFVIRFVKRGAESGKVFVRSRELRDQALQGADFVAIAKQYPLAGFGNTIGRNETHIPKDIRVGVCAEAGPDNRTTSRAEWRTPASPGPNRMKGVGRSSGRRESASHHETVPSLVRLHSQDGDRSRIARCITSRARAVRRFRT
jgi:hypothetical protein